MFVLRTGQRGKGHKMELYIENKSLGFVRRAYEVITENTKATVYRAVVFNRGAFFKPAAQRFLKKKGIYDIEYVLFGTAALRPAMRLLNRGISCLHKRAEQN